MAPEARDVRVEATVDVEPTHLVLEVLVHNESHGAIREVRISPELEGGLAPDAAAKGIAGLPAGHSGRASFSLRPPDVGAAVADVGVAVSYLDARGARRTAAGPRVRLNLALPPLTPGHLAPEDFADRASRAFGHRISFASPEPPEGALGAALGALEPLSLGRIAEPSPSEASGRRASLFAVDARGTGYFARIVAAPRRRGSSVRVNLFSESELGLFALRRRVREALGPVGA